MTFSTEKRRLLIRGGSMVPVLQTGDIVDLREVTPAELRIGDILVFTAPDSRQIIHRIVRLHPLQTRGDNCAADDAPVPAASPLYLAVSRCRDGKVRPLSSGFSGQREFRRHQIRNRLLRQCRKLLRPLAELNPFRTPFSRLTRTRFGDRTIYYAGKRPAGWQDGTGWHWLRRMRFQVRKPPAGEQEK